MKQSPKISIVLPSYNRVDYLKKSIESCLNQTLTDFELIIVDDASGDNSPEIIKRYAAQDRRIKFIQNAINKKLPATLNTGFEQAKGDYFTWISDDNLFHPDALGRMAKCLDSMPHIGLVYTDYTLIDEQGSIGKRIRQEEPEFLPIRDCVGACFLYRAEIAAKVGGYNENMFLVEDYEYWLRFGLVAKLFHIKESLYFYRTHARSLTKTRIEEIRLAKNELKKIYGPKYKIDKKHRPINDLYIWFIGERDLKSYFKLAWIIMRHPFVTLSYIIRNLRRL